MSAEAFQSIFAVEHFNEIALVISFFICGECFSGGGKRCECFLFFVGSCDCENDEVVAITCDAGNVYEFAFFVRFFVNNVGSAVRAFDLIAGSKEICCPVGSRHGCVDGNCNNSVSFAEEIDFLLVVEAVCLRVERHNVICTDVTGRNLCCGYGFIGMELGTHAKVCVYGVPAAGIPGRDESADDGRFGIVCAATDAVMRIRVHNKVLSFRKSYFKYP